MIVPQRDTSVKDILLFIGGAATGLLGALILSGEGNEGPGCELECEEEEVEELEEDEGKEVDEGGLNQPVGAE